MKNLSKKIVSAILSLSFFSGIFLPSAKAGKFTETPTNVEQYKYDSEYFSFCIAINTQNVIKFYLRNIKTKEKFNNLSESEQFEEVKKMVFLDYCKKYKNYDYETVCENIQEDGYIINFLNTFCNRVLKNKSEFELFSNKPTEKQLSEIKKYLCITEDELTSDSISDNIPTQYLTDYNSSINSTHNSQTFNSDNIPTQPLTNSNSTQNLQTFNSDNMSTQPLTNSNSTHNLQTFNSDNMSTQPLANSNSTQNSQNSNSENIQIIHNSETSINSSSNFSIKKPQKLFIGKFELKTNKFQTSIPIKGPYKYQIRDLIKKI